MGGRTISSGVSPIAEHRGLDMVAAPFHRIEENAETSSRDSAPVAPGVELPCGQSRHSGQQSGLPIERAARSGAVRRIIAELHRSRLVHPHRGAARRPLRHHRSPDGAPFRLPVAASAVHVRVTVAPCRTRRLLSQVPRPHDRSRACTVPRPCPAAVRVGGISDRADHRASCTTCLDRTGASTLRSFPESAPPDRGDHRRRRSAGRGARPARRSSRPCRRPRTVGSGCPGAREWLGANGR